MPADSLEDLLRACVVRVEGQHRSGTGFFVAPRMVLTCCHVVGESAAVEVRWRDESTWRSSMAQVMRRLRDRGRPMPDLDEDYPDVALVRITRQGHPCVALDEAPPATGDELSSYGFPDEGGSVDLTPALLTCRGMKGTEPTVFIDLKSDTVRPGMSGAPVLNIRSGKVCGILVATRSPVAPDGGFAVPWGPLASSLPEVLDANRAFHRRDRRWVGAHLTGRTRARPHEPTVTWDGVPFRNPAFSGRGEIFDDLQRAFSIDADTPLVVALSGMPGVGKTQLAVEYAYRRQAAYELVAWIHGDSAVTMTGDLGRLAQKLDVDVRPDQREMIELLFAKLADRQRWLLVYDNVSRQGPVVDHLPRRGHGHVLLTSRDAAWGAVARTTLAISPFSRAESVEFLTARAGESGRGAQLTAAEVAGRLGDLPLALEQAGAYIEETRTGLAGYLGRIESRLGQMLDQGQPAHYETTLAAAVTLVLEEITGQPGRHRTLAKDILELCAHVAPDLIPLRFVDEALRHPPKLLLDRALGVIWRYSLLSSEPGGLRMHRLIQQVTRDAPGCDEERWTRTAAAALDRLLDVPEDVRTWPAWAELIPHLQVVAASPTLSPDDPTVASLLIRGATYLWRRSQVAAAESLAERAVLIAGDDQQTQGRAIRTLGWLAKDRFDPPGAIERFRAALGVDERRAQGRRDAGVAADHFGLGWALNDCQDYDTARTHFERALDALPAPLAPGQAPGDSWEVGGLLGTWEILLSLGWLAKSAGDPDEARRRFDGALAAHRQEAGGTGGGAAQIHRALGWLAVDLGRTEEAQSHFDESLRLSSQLPDEGPRRELSASLRDVGRLIWDRAQIEETQGDRERAQADYLTARRYYTRALDIDSRMAAGTFDRFVAMDTLGLAWTALKLDEPATAGQHFTHVRQLDPDPDSNHSDVRFALLGLGWTELRQGNLDSAERYLDDCLRLSLARKGERSRDAIRTRWALAVTLDRLGRTRDADRQLDRAQAAAHDHFGPAHPITQTLERGLPGRPGGPSTSTIII